VPTFVLKCQVCGHEHQTPPNYKYSEIKNEQCQQCDAVGTLQSIPQGGTGFQLSQRNVTGSVGSDPRGCGFTSRGRCGGVAL